MIPVKKTKNERLIDFCNEIMLRLDFIIGGDKTLMIASKNPNEENFIFKAEKVLKDGIFVDKQYLNVVKYSKNLKRFVNITKVNCPLVNHLNEKLKDPDDFFVSITNVVGPLKTCTIVEVNDWVIDENYTVDRRLMNSINTRKIFQNDPYVFVVAWIPKAS